MTACGIADEFNREPIFRTLKHAERFAETEIAHDVERQVITPICNILRCTPTFLFFWDCGCAAEVGTKGSDVGEDVLLH